MENISEISTNTIERMTYQSIAKGTVSNMCVGVPSFSFPSKLDLLQISECVLIREVLIRQRYYISLSIIPQF